jgi:hypothetical protein
VTTSDRLDGPKPPETFGLDDMGAWSLGDDAVLFAVELAKRTGVPPEIDEWRHEERERLGRHAGGAPTRFPDEAVWVAMILAALHDRPMLATSFTDILFRRISPAMRDRLGVPDPPEPNDRLAWEALYRCVRTRLHGLLEPIDPSPLPKNRRLDPGRFDAAVASHRAEHQLTDDVLAARSERLAWVANAIVEASWTLLPPEVKRQWHGSVGVDATPVPAFARADKRVPGTQPRSKRAVVAHSADPDAALYVRSDTPEGPHPTTRGGTKLRDLVCAYEATLVVAGTDDPPTSPSRRSS